MDASVLDETMPKTDITGLVFMARQDTSKVSDAVGIAHRILSVSRAEMMSSAVAQRGQPGTALLAFPNNQRCCPEHEASSGVVLTRAKALED